VVEEKVQYIFNNARADVYNIRRELVKEIIHTMKEETSELSGTYSTTGKELTNMSHSMEQDLHMLKEMHRELPMMRAKVNELRENIQNFSRNNETEDEKPTKKGRK
jgi:chromosome segregation ATPase